MNNVEKSTTIHKDKVIDKIAGDFEAKGFMGYRNSGKVSLNVGLYLGLKSIFVDLPKALIFSFPGAVGMLARREYCRLRFKAMGFGCLFGEGIFVRGETNISLKDFVFIDSRVTLDAFSGAITVGRRVHIAPGALISGTFSEVSIGDYAAIGADAKIYAHSESPTAGLRTSGPMIEERYKGMITAPVTIGKDALVGAGAVLLPGVCVGEGAVIAANSLVSTQSHLRPWGVYAGVPARLCGLRERVKVPDI